MRPPAPLKGTATVRAVIMFSKPSSIGRTAIALTDLRPSGFVDMDGQRVDALSEGDMVRKGQTVEVIRDLGTEVVVRLQAQS